MESNMKLDQMDLPKELVWKDYDLGKATQALAKGVGILKGVDVEALVRDIRKARRLEP
jgi:hypothetical protein